MKEGWEIVILKDIFSKVNGLWTGKKEPFVDVKVYTMTNFTKDSFLDKQKEPREIVASLSQFKKRKLLKDDILVEKSGGGPNQPVGRAVLFDIENEENNTFSNFTTRLRLNEHFKDKISPSFVHHFLRLKYVNGETEQFQKNSTNIRNLQLDKYLDQSFSFPPLPEQQRIVSILDEAFTAIAKAKANAEQNLKNAKELFESYLQGVFENGNWDWEVKCLDELGTITSSKRIYKSEYVKDGVPFYRTKEIKELSNGKPITLELFISKDRYEQIKKSFGVPQIGDLLMSAVGTIGEIMVIENENEFYFKDGNIVWFKDFQRLDTNYLKYALTAFVEKIKSLAIGAAYSALTIEKLNKYEIAFPKTKEEQQTIVRQLDALRAETQKLEAVYQKKIADLEELKKSILQKAFAGELKTEKAVAV